MKKLSIALVLTLAAAGLWSCKEGRSKAERLLENYAEVTIPAPDLSDITDNGKEVLNLYRFAADEADAIYWKQVFGEKAFFSALPEDERDFAYVNYGPWNRIDGSAFLEGFGPRRPGANFYPEDMTVEEFQAWDNPDKNSPYTII